MVSLTLSLWRGLHCWDTTEEPETLSSLCFYASVDLNVTSSYLCLLNQWSFDVKVLLSIRKSNKSVHLTLCIGAFLPSRRPTLIYGALLLANRHKVHRLIGISHKPAVCCSEGSRKLLLLSVGSNSSFSSFTPLIKLRRCVCSSQNTADHHFKDTSFHQTAGILNKIPPCFLCWDLSEGISSCTLSWRNASLCFNSEQCFNLHLSAGLKLWYW